MTLFPSKKPLISWGVFSGNRSSPIVIFAAVAVARLDITMKQLALAENSTSVSDLLTVSEAAEYLRISAWTLRHWVSDKKITFIKIGRAVRFRKTHLDAFIRHNLHGKDVKPDS